MGTSEAPKPPADETADAPSTTDAPSADAGASAAPSEAAPASEAKAETPPAAPAAAPAPAPTASNSLAKSVLTFVVIVCGVAGVFALLGSRDQTAPAVPTPAWSVGEAVELNITLVASDVTDLGCSSPDEVAGRHCAFASDTRPFAKGDPNDDKALLRPYTTTEGQHLLGAGLWSELGMSTAKLPPNRFTVRCKYTVEGKLAKVGVRWRAIDKWHEWSDWHTGLLSECKLQP